jgi:hypothetical protein
LLFFVGILAAPSTVKLPTNALKGQSTIVDLSFEQQSTRQAFSTAAAEQVAPGVGQPLNSTGGAKPRQRGKFNRPVWWSPLRLGTPQETLHLFSRNNELHLKLPVAPATGWR